MLNPIHLQTLVEVVKSESFAVAARRLGYTASAVSQQMGALERAVDVPLFEREPHGVRPNSTARLIAHRAVEVLAAFDGLDEEVRGIAQGRRGRLRLGAFPTASARLVPHAVAGLCEARPDAEILLDEAEPDQLIPAVLAGELDVAVVYAYDLVPHNWPSELTRTPLVHERLVVLVPDGHRATRRRTVRLADLRDERWIGSRTGTEGATCLLRLCAAHGFVPNVAFRSNDYDAVGGLVSAGVGVALVPALGYQPHQGSRGLPYRADDAGRQVLALHRTANANPLLEEAVDALTRAGRAVANELVVAPSVPA